MKIPFLKGRISNEFKQYLDELQGSVESSVNIAKTSLSTDLFSTLYPLFVIIRSLSNSDYYRNPVKDIVLAELQTKNDKKRFIEAVAYFNREHEYHAEFKSGMQRQVFTGYFQELFSDALLLLNSFYTNNYRGSQIALRCMLEDLYRHLYYRDHQQELWAINEGKYSEYDLRLKPSIFREYLTRTEYLSIFNQINTNFLPKQKGDKTLFDTNEELYSEFSAAVHGSGSISLNSFQSNLDFITVPSKSSVILHACKQFTEMAVAFLTSAHIDQFQAFNEYERSLVLSKFSNARRAALRKALNV